MTPDPEGRLLLDRMEDARRQTQRQLNMIDREITRRMTAAIPSLGEKHAHYRRSRPPDARAFLARYRATLAALTGERQTEIDALSRKLAWQDDAIRALRERLGLDHDAPAESCRPPSRRRCRLRTRLKETTSA
ncbi:hypothetical protein [Bradyrhizobium sp.]|uniref:hypothetical protein n=1 Tax=Bradyrhizobium sp. TaxID=376 RepID=UPI0039E706CC